MKRLTGKLGVLAVIFAAVSLLMPTTAHAVGVGVITGAGTIGPNGVPGPTGGTVSNSAVSFDGTATGVFVNANGPTADVGSCTIAFDGGGTDSTAVGTGGGTAACNGTGVLGNSIGLNCTLSYTRVGIVVVVVGGCPETMVGVFIFVPNNVNPTTSYQLVGAAATLAN
jgi:hypothetical protein